MKKISQAPLKASPSCFTCKKLESEFPEPLKYCAKCRATTYCSRECQKADWASHKSTCLFPRSVSYHIIPKGSGSAQNLGFEVMNHLNVLSKDDFLHNIPEKEVFSRIIDSFRMRMDDEYVFSGNIVGLYNGEKPLPLFKKFLSLAESRQGLLPTWWTPEKRQECEKLAVDGSQWSDINCALEKSDIQAQYKDSSMPLKLRVLGDKIYGKDQV